MNVFVFKFLFFLLGKWEIGCYLASKCLVPEVHFCGFSNHNEPEEEKPGFGVIELDLSGHPDLRT